MRADDFDFQRSCSLVAWDDVADSCRDRFLRMPDEEHEGLWELYLEWPGELTVETLDARFKLPSGFTASDLYRVEAVAGPLNQEIEALLADYEARILSALQQKWNRGDFVRALFSTRYVPNEPSTEGNFYSKSMGLNSFWVVKMSLSRLEYPDIAGVADRMQELQQSRDGRVRALLASLEPRPAESGR